jgi:membrane protease subunit HflC
VQRALRFIVSGVVVLGVLAFLTTYTVRYTEAVVVTTFGRANESSVFTDPGLRLKWPYPVQSVIRYDRRIRLVETLPETRQTADNRQFILASYLTWRVKDPLKFFRSYGGGPSGPDSVFHFNAAESALRASLRSAMAEVSSFQSTDLLSTTLQSSRLPELEARIMTALRSAGGGTGGVSLLEASGVEAISVGVYAIKLPEAVSRTVIEREKATREAIAADVLNRGKSQAETTRARAESDANKILAFAEAQAAIIRARGDEEAAPFYQMQQDNGDPSLAIFLKTLENLREFYSQRTTVIVPFSAPGMNVMSPDLLRSTPTGKVPAFSTDAPAAKVEPKADPKGSGADGKGGR